MKVAALDAQAYQAAFQLTSEAAAFVDPEDRIAATNHAFAELFGGAGMDGASFTDPFPPDERSRIANLLRDARRWSETSLKGVRLGSTLASHVDLWASQFVAAGGERFLLVRARSAAERLEAERLHEASVLAARACNEAMTWATLTESVRKVVSRVLPQGTGGARLQRVDDSWVAVGAYGALEAWAKGAAFPNASIWGRFARQRESVMIADAAFELRGEDSRLDPPILARAFIATPMLVGDQVDALFVVIASEIAAFTLHDVRCLEAVTREMSSATSRIQAYEKLEETHAALGYAFDENARLLERVSRLNAEIEDFALWTTHDLREPLRGLATLAHFTSLAAKGDDAGELRELAAQLESSATRLKEHVLSLHAFHEAARDSGQRECADLDALLQTAIAQMGPDLGVVVNASGVRIDADPVRVTRALVDMLRFAASRPSRPVRIEVTKADSGLARVSIEMNEEIAARTAEAAFHVVGAAKEGSLALARRIALQHGGSLAFESRPRSRLTLVLPTVG